MPAGRHGRPQRQRRRLLPLRRRRAAVRALRHGRGLHGADDDRRPDDGQAGHRTRPRRRACASSRPTAWSSSTATTTSTTASRAARRCRSPHPPARSRSSTRARSCSRARPRRRSRTCARTRPTARSSPRAAAYWRVAGGAAVTLTNCGVLGNCAGAVPVDPATISGGGAGRLLAVPRDGTVLRGMPSNGLWEIIGGQRRQTFVNVAGRPGRRRRDRTHPGAGRAPRRWSSRRRRSSRRSSRAATRSSAATRGSRR